MNSPTVGGVVLSGSFSALGSENTFVGVFLLPNFEASQPMMKDSPTTRIIPTILRTKIDIFHKSPQYLRLSRAYSELVWVKMNWTTAILDTL